MKPRGNLSISIEKADLGRDVCTIHKMSPYLVIQLGKLKKECPVANSMGQHPVWKGLNVNLEVFDERELKITAYHHRQIGKDEVIAYCDIDITQFMNNTIPQQTGTLNKIWVYHNHRYMKQMAGLLYGYIEYTSYCQYEPNNQPQQVIYQPQNQQPFQPPPPQNQQQYNPPQNQQQQVYQPQNQNPNTFFQYNQYILPGNNNFQPQQPQNYNYNQQYNQINYGQQQQQYQMNQGNQQQFQSPSDDSVQQHMGTYQPQDYNQGNTLEPAKNFENYQESDEYRMQMNQQNNQQQYQQTPQPYQNQQYPDVYGQQETKQPESNKKYNYPSLD